MPKLATGAGFGALFLFAGLGMMVMMATDQTGLNAPLWVAEAAASCFALAGGSIIAQAYQKTRLSRALSLGVVYGLAVPGLWIAFGSDGGGCSSSVSIGLLSFAETASGMSCRLAFGLGAVVTLACAVALTYAIIRSIGPRPGRSAGEVSDSADKASRSGQSATPD